jgi:hypothetical protein
MEMMRMKKILFQWKSMAAMATSLVVILGPVSMQTGSVFFSANLALAVSCSSGTLATPQTNANLFAQGTSGAGAAYACSTTAADGTLSGFDYFNTDGTAFGAANTTINPNTGTVQGTNQNGQKTSTTDCTSYRGYINPSCWIDTISTWAAAIVIGVAITILEWIGWLFNLSISYTVLGFNNLITGTVLDAISTGWTLFRDIANIVIIGLFVFIAICIILGIKSYGQKSLIARVLIVAVLINFSFLFTRIVINFSNAVAIQFAKFQPLDAQVTTIGAKPPDIAGKFTQLMGVKSLSNTKDTLQNISKNNNSTLIALMHALIVTIITLGVAIVLLYGAILLIVRAVIMIFLLVTSSLAFATYLLPSLAQSDFGWKAWWIALFRNALLAPMMMLFLVVTLRISTGLVSSLDPSGQNASANNGVGVLGALASNPNDPKNVGALMIYVIILGLLYGAIRISNRFAGAAGQFAWSGTLPFANATVAWPSRSLGFLGRNTIGRGAQRVSSGLQERAKAANLRNPGGFGQFAWDKLAQGVKTVAKRDLNPGNMTGVKAAQTNRGGFVGQEKRRKDAIAERAKRNTFTDTELAESRKALEKARAETGSGWSHKER